MNCPEEKRLPLTAYFCMEFGLHESFRIYAGGLGILAGDILKTARDEGLPMVGIGILWRQGYTTQTIDRDGVPCDTFRDYRYDFLNDTGVTVSVNIRKQEVACRVWLCDSFGNAPLYLLDTNIPENRDSERLLTGQLYGWFSEERVAQEIILGIGGARALKKLGIAPDIYHFNDSHPVLAGVELIRADMESGEATFEEAWEKTRKRIVFTTHTPVAAGNELHEHDLLKYMGAYNGLDHTQMARLGGDPFSMTIAGLRLSKKSNAVSALHSNTAKNMWGDTSGASEIISVTNGVHNGTWQDGRMVQAFRDGSDLVAAHKELKRELIDEVYRRKGVKLDENALTIGFARRAVPYKRSSLIFSDMDKMSRLLTDRRLQLIFSGKAHPNDLKGKSLIEGLNRIAGQYPGSIVFLEDYDMKLGKLLTRGCDVWLNNPVRPLEACGTSGIKAAMNGVLNLSVLDGWWPEGCVHGVNGWQVGNGYEGVDCDRVDAEALYKVLLGEVLPLFYGDRARWGEMMRESIRMSQYSFSASRMLKEYFSLMYAKG